MSKQRDFTPLQLAFTIVMDDHVGAGVFTSVNRHNKHVEVDESFTKFLRTGKHSPKKTGIKLRALYRNSMLFKGAKKIQLMK
jgi:hypothetical protein